MAETEAPQEIVGPKKSLEELTTPEDYLDFTVEKIGQSVRRLAFEKDWFAGEEQRQPINVKAEIEQMEGHLRQLFDIYRFGGRLGDHRFLPHELPAHGIRHVLLQTALKADLATTVALMDEKDRPFYSVEEKGERHSFSYGDWKTEVYSSLLHEIGYLREETFGASGKGWFSARSNIQIHEEVGADLAMDIGSAWGLADQGVNLDQLKRNILATKMADHKPIHFEELSKLSWEEIGHITDLLSYTLIPDYVPDGIAGLWWEWKGFVFPKQNAPVIIDRVNLAESKFATGSLTRFVSSCFLKPGIREDDNYSWGEGPANLIKILFDRDSWRFKDWKEMHERNVGERGREQLLVEIVGASKESDGLQLEGSINPYRLGQAAEKFVPKEDYRRVCVESFEEMLAQQQTPTAIFERLPTPYLREIFTTIGDREGQKDFLAELIYGVIEESAEENSQTIQIKLSPYAWQFAAGSKAEQTHNAQFFVEAFQKAKEKFLGSKKRGKRSPKDIQLAITLRQEDGLEKNQQLIRELGDSSISQIDIAGDETTNRWSVSDTIAASEEIKKWNPETEVAVVLGELPAGERDKQAEALSKWKKLVSSGAPVDRLLYPASLIENNEFLDAVLETDKTVIMLPVNQALFLGYTLEQIVEFIKSFPEEKRKRGQLKLVGGNTMLDSLSVQLFRLVDAGLPKDFLKDLGVEFSA